MGLTEFRYDRIEDINDYGVNIMKYLQLSNITRHYGLNRQENVGNISNLIRQKHFETSKEWIKHYLESGEESYAGRLDGSLLATEHGRTKSELLILIHTLYNNIQKDTHLVDTHFNLLKDVTLEQCYKSFTFLILGHSWNGMIIRENNVIAELQREYYLNEYTFEQSSPKIDIDYGVDVVVKKDGVIVAGIQVKPAKYLHHKMNISDYAKKQHAAFKKEFSVNIVKYIYADDLGVIDDDMGNNVFYVD